MLGVEAGEAPVSGQFHTKRPAAVNPGSEMRMRSSFLLTSPVPPA